MVILAEGAVKSLQELLQTILDEQVGSSVIDANGNPYTIPDILNSGNSGLLSATFIWEPKDKTITWLNPDGQFSDQPFYVVL